jgi:hypothetical protein
MQIPQYNPQGGAREAVFASSIVSSSCASIAEGAAVAMAAAPAAFRKLRLFILISMMPHRWS